MPFPADPDPRYCNRCGHLWTHTMLHGDRWRCGPPLGSGFVLVCGCDARPPEGAA